MPRNPNNKSEFIAGVLPTVKIQDPQTGVVNTYYVDGRLEELRNVNDFMDKITCVDDTVWDMLSPEDKNTVAFEFMGETIN